MKITPTLKLVSGLVVVFLTFADWARAVDRETYLKNTGALNTEIVSQWTTALNEASGETITRTDIFALLPSIEIMFTNGAFLDGVSKRLLTRMKAAKGLRDEWGAALRAATGDAVRGSNVVLFLVQFDSLYDDQTLLAEKERIYLAALKSLSREEVTAAANGGKFEAMGPAIWKLIEERYAAMPAALKTVPPSRPAGTPMVSTPAPPALGIPPPPQATPPPTLDFSRYNKYLVLVEGNVGSGSGFLIHLKGNVLIATNSHVLSGNDTISFSLLNSTKLSRGTLGVAWEYDLAVITQHVSREGLKIMEGVEHEAAIGDDVVVLGNSQGSKVVTQLPGKITGIGPELVEVDAKFVGGNSGSPIIHVKTGKVIGVATYAEKKEVDWVTKDSKFTEIRRFGYRLDNVPKWEFPSWEAFQQEARTIAKIQGHTDNLIVMLKDIHDNGRVSLQLHQANDNRLRRYAAEFVETTNRTELAIASIEEAKGRFLRSMASEAMGDLASYRPEAFTSYHGKLLREQIELRKLIKQEFEKIRTNR